MTQFFTKLASGVTALALVASFFPATLFAEEAPADNTIVDETVVELVTTETETEEKEEVEETPSTSVELSSSTESEEMSSLAVVPLATNDGGAFDSFTTGSINGQGGWKVTGPYDQAIVENTTGPASFGLKALRFSNGVASGSFGDQMFSPSLPDEAGETSAANNGFSGGTRMNHFVAEFDFASATTTYQPGLAVSVSPDRGDGARMSYLRFEDTAAGIDVYFDDVTSVGGVASFVETKVATGLARDTAHTAKLEVTYVDGPSNDLVEVSIDGDSVHSGTTWEDYFRFAEDTNTRTTDSLIFMARGAAVPANLGGGFLFDHVKLSTENVTFSPISENVVVTAADLETETNRFTAAANGSGKWFFYNDENDTIDNTLGSFVTGPATAPLGTASVQVSVTGTERRNLATYQFAGTALAEINELGFSTYNPSAGNGGSVTRSAYLVFNVDFDGSDSWQRRLEFVPSRNGTVTQDTWQAWDAINGGNALWTYSGTTWPGTATSGSTARTWNDILASYPNAKIRTTDAFVGLRVGEPYADGYTENIDKFVFGTNTETTIFDFDVEAVTGNTGGNGGGGRSGGSRRSVDNDNDGEVAGASTGGEVLGASTYNFTVDLTIGSTGADVTALQQFLIDAGFLSIPAPTGYFGEMTRAAVAKWQASRGITPAAGYFGPISRAAIGTEGTPAPAMTAEQRAALIKELLEKVKELQEKLDAMDA